MYIFSDVILFYDVYMFYDVNILYYVFMYLCSMMGIYFYFFISENEFIVA